MSISSTSSSNPALNALNGFGAIMILQQAIKTANSTDPKALIKALETGTFKSWPDAPVILWNVAISL